MKTAIAENVVLALVAFSTLGVSRGDDFSPPARGATSAATKLEGTYEGAWTTTKNRKLDGTASCQVKQLSNGRWQGRFGGQWQQMPFDYAVEFRAGEKQTRLVSEANAGKLRKALDPFINAGTRIGRGGAGRGDEAVAQAYLVSLLGTKERRPNEPKRSRARTERKKKRPDPQTPPTV
jgi:hypothetical protein